MRLGSGQRFLPWIKNESSFESNGQGTPGDDSWIELATTDEALWQALEAGKFKARVRADFRSGVRSGVNGTPTFFINGNRHDGPFEYENLVVAIQGKIGKQRNPVNA